MQYKKNISTFLFYDYETFGKHTSLDKPAQFACMRTDMELNIIDDPKYFYCIPSDDYLPDPHAVLITYITPQYTHKYGTNEYYFTNKIYNILIQPNTCVIGYNNINFDDEITRNIFYRNFFDSYEWSWKNGNSRWDLLNVLRACYTLRPSGIQWPKNELGCVSFKLSDIAQANNIIHEHAHDAVSDVYATIEIAKLIKIKKPRLFDFFFNMRKKYELQKFINVKKFIPVVYVSSYFGMIRHNFSVILPIMTCKSNENTLIAIDLLQDTTKLISLFKVIRINNNICIKDLFNFGVIIIYLNRCPILAPIEVIRPKDYQRLHFNLDLCNKNIELIRNNYFLIEYIENILSQKRNIKKSLNVDLQIYDSFFNIHDKKIIHSIRHTKSIHFNNMNYNFHDSRLTTLFFRYRARNFFYTLNQHDKKLWLQYCTKVLNPIFLEEYESHIHVLLKKYENNFKKVILLKQLLNYAIYKKKIFLSNNTNIN